MGAENIKTDQVGQRWCIDLGWHEQHNRSFLSLAQRYLCPQCHEQLTGEMTAAELLTAIKNCCSKVPGFITGEVPILDSMFRLFLANGNQPLAVEELGKQLSEWRGGDIYRTSPEILSCLLNSDQFYGLRPVKD